MNPERVAYSAPMPSRFAALAFTPLRFTAILGALTIMGPMAVSALDSDREQPIRITADSALREENSGLTEYTGNVVLTQGSLSIRAQRLRVDQSNPQNTLITATGSPATLEQTPSIDSAPVVANANRIVYQQAKELVQLIDDARIEQQGAIITGAAIDYSVAEQRVSASGQAGDSNRQRVEVVIPASVVDGKSDTDAPRKDTIKDPSHDD